VRSVNRVSFFVLLLLLSLVLATRVAAARTYTISKVYAPGDPAPTGNFLTTGAGADLNDAGDAAWDAVAGTVSQSGPGVFLKAGGTITKLVSQGDPAPGTGGVYDTFVLTSLSNAGAVCFFAIVSNTSSWSGLFLKSGAGTLPIALAGSPAPGSGSPFNGFGDCKLNESGQAAFYASLYEEGVPAGSTRDPSGIFRFSAAGAEAVALIDQPAPGTGGSFMGFGTPPSINDSGDVAFTGRYGLSVSSTGIFVASGGVIAPVALPGDPAPGTGGAFSLFEGVSINNAGEIAFRGGASGLMANDGIFLHLSGGIEPVALQGEQAPGTGGGLLEQFQPRALINDRGDVVFQATYGSGTTGSGIFVRDGHTGDLSPVVLTGQPAPDLPGQTIVTIVGGTLAINGNGQVLFVARLSGLSFRNYLATPDPIPDSVPALSGWGAAGMVVLLLLGGVWRSCARMRESVPRVNS